MSWRLRARAAIDEVLATAPTHPEAKDLADVIRSIDAAYPFDMRKYWPYKMWLSERGRAIAKLRGHLPSSAKDPTRRLTAHERHFDEQTFEMFP